jgi:hypothetical protein
VRNIEEMRFIFFDYPKIIFPYSLVTTITTTKISATTTIRSR